MQLYQDYKYL